MFETCVSLIEWPVRLRRAVDDDHDGAIAIPAKRLEVDIRIVPKKLMSDDDDDDTNPRRLTLRPVGAEWEDCLESLRREGYLDDMLLPEESRDE